MSKKMLINASHPEENRVAIVVDGLLSELDIEIAGQEQTKGNIYKAVVVRVESGLQAAFVDYGAEKLGFLQIGEIHPSYFPSKDDAKGRPRIGEILQRGQEILVQIVKEERGSKGAALTTNLSIPGRYMVLMPDSTTKGVSRKIQDESERKKLKRTMAELDLPERMGYIVRTAGIGKAKEELKRDFDYLVRLYHGILARKDQVKAPSQLYQESNLVIRSIRDYFSTEMDEVLIDDQRVYQETRDFFALVMPELSNLVKQHRERRPIFSRYQIEDQIETLSKNQIPLPSGGSIVIDQTEALVAVDVNSGKMSSETGIEATAVKTNLEAALEVGRQLRLRDLGGLVVIDFIDMRDRKHIREVEQELRKALQDDKAKVSVGRISQFGLMEMSRQRLKPTLSVGAYLDCPHCQGKGRIRSAENQAVGLLRQIHTAASKGHIGHIEAWVPLDVANDLLNRKRQSLVDLEKNLNLRVTIFGRAGMKPGELDLELHKREKSDEHIREIAPVTHANQIESALAAVSQDEKVEPEQAEQAAAPSPQAADGAVEDKPEEKKSRRKRRRRRKKTDKSPEAAAAQSTEQPAPETQQQSEPTTAAAAGDNQADKAAVKEERAEPAPPQQSETPAAEAAAATQDKPKPRRRRSTKKAAEENPQAASETAATQDKPKPRSRRTTKKTAEENPQAASETAATQDKPKPRSRRTTKKTAEENPQAASETAATQDKPKPRSRRTTKKTAEENPQAASETAATQDKPKPRSRRTTKKTAEENPQTASETAATQDKPKPRSRRTTKKTAEENPQTASETAATQDKPKPRSRRTTKKTSDNATQSATGTASPTEEKPKRRTRRPAKKNEPSKPIEDTTSAE